MKVSIDEATVSALVSELRTVTFTSPSLVGASESLSRRLAVLPSVMLTVDEDGSVSNPGAAAAGAAASSSASVRQARTIIPGGGHEEARLPTGFNLPMFMRNSSFPVCVRAPFLCSRAHTCTVATA